MPTMSDRSVRILEPGQVVNSHGVTFTVHTGGHQLLSNVSSNPPGFAWQWFLFGRAFVRSAPGVDSFDCAALSAVFEGRFHLITLPKDEGVFAYQNARIPSLSVSSRYKRKLLGRSRLDSIAVTMSEEFAMAVEVANTVSSGAVHDDDALGDFGVALGQGRAPGQR